jgi:glutamine synthetase
MADRFTFLRILLKEIAKRHGLFVTYMPKPAQGDWRSGAHINWSVQSTASPGKNLFKDEASGDWSETARWAAGGALKHGVALTAVNCPTVNSYKGLIGRAREFEGGTVTWAPTHITYGVNNRSAMIRFPQARFAIENRAVDMCVNPYLGLAMTCAASLEGIREQLDPGPPLAKSLYELTEAEREGVKPLPRNLDQAITGFAADPLAKHVFGDTMHRLYTLHKQDEWDRFHETITDWEKREYLRFF